jgi:hypothetical protein
MARANDHGPSAHQWSAVLRGSQQIFLKTLRIPEAEKTWRRINGLDKIMLLLQGIAATRVQNVPHPSVRPSRASRFDRSMTSRAQPRCRRFHEQDRVVRFRELGVKEAEPAQIVEDQTCCHQEAAPRGQSADTELKRRHIMHATVEIRLKQA